MSDIAVPPPAGFVDNTVLLNPNPIQQGAVIKPKKKRNLPGTPDPNAEVIALSPRTLMATNRFVCEVCKKGFQRDQNLQLHRRGHNLPWKLRQRNGREIRKRAYVCPEMSCVHHHPSRALGDLTGIKKHFSRKHGEKKWKCEKCSKKYAVQTDWKAHSKTCGTREYRCDCGTLFSRKDSFVTHRAFCDAMAEASARATSLDTNTTTTTNNNNLNYKSTNPPATSNMVVPPFTSYNFSPILRPNFPALNGEMSEKKPRLSLWLDQQLKGSITTPNFFAHPTVSLPEFTTGLVQLAPPPPPLPPPVSLFGGMKEEGIAMGSKGNLDSFFNNPNHQADNNPHMSATALLQKAAQMGATSSNPCAFAHGFGVSSSCDMLMGLNQNQFRVLMGGEEEKQPTENLHDMMNSLSNYGMFFQGGSGNADGFLGMLVAEGKQEGESEAEGVVLPYFSRGEQGSRVHVNQEVENGLTRDFLGVGRDSGGGPFTQRELAKMASIRSAMDLNPYNSAH